MKGPVFRIGGGLRGLCLLAAATVILLLAAAPASAISKTYHVSNAAGGQDCTLIGSWDAATETCTLNTDISTAGIDAIHIDSDGITLDGGGHTLTGSGSLGYGVYLAGRSGVTVKNLIVTKFSDGIFLTASSSNVINSDAVSANGTNGIEIESYSDGNTISGNTVNSNGSNGINTISASDGNAITGNTVNSNGNNGISLGSCSGETVSANTTSYNANGIILGSAYYNDLTGNTSTSNNDGIYAYSQGSYNSISNNTIGSNSAYGINLTSSDYNKVYDNTVSSTGVAGDGIYLASSSNNVISRNDFNSNFRQAGVSGGSGNVFSLPMPGGGNYWSTWTTPDSDHDGIVDNPYVIASGVQDSSPWAMPDGWLRDYFWSWYDNQSSGASDWVLMANPAAALNSLYFSLSVQGASKTLPGGGQVTPGHTLFTQYPGLIGGPVTATSLTSGFAVTSQRTLWAGNSLEEVPGRQTGKLTNDYFWPWYDQKSPGITDWLLIANQGVDHQDNPQGIVTTTVKLGGAVLDTYMIAPGQSIVRTFPGQIGGPLEVSSTGGDVITSQRVLSNYGAAFNEVPGIPAAELSSSYLWTWYDEKSPGAADWVIVANPADAAAPIYYNVFIGGAPAIMDGGPVAPGAAATSDFSGKRGGPVEVMTFTDPAHPGVSGAKSICTQRSLWGPSFEEVPGLAVAYAANGYSAINSDYQWTWYDEQSPGATDWVMIANPTGSPMYYEIDIAGVKVMDDKSPGGPGPISPMGTITPDFPHWQNGPVEVKTFSDAAHTVAADSVSSQRVLWNGYFNEVWGTP